MLFRSPAKVNLFLRVLKKREDGFHEIASLFSAINLFDFLTVSTSNHNRFTCSSPHLPLDENNLVVRALHLFREKTGLKFPVEINLEKHIPMEAGLGGGSSNGATTLYALNQLFDAPLSKEQLMELGSLLGSDVPFFFSSGAAYCTGRGELVTDVSIPAYSFNLHQPQVGSPTPAVFKAFDLSFRSHLSPLDLLKSFQEHRPLYVNDLESAAFVVNPALKAFKESLSAQYETVAMSGSGSAFICSPGNQVSTIRKESHWF